MYRTHRHHLPPIHHFRYRVVALHAPSRLIVKRNFDIVKGGRGGAGWGEVTEVEQAGQDFAGGERMAIVMRQELLGLTREQAEAIVAQENAQARTAPGFTARASGPMAGGYHVTEIWEAREAFERFSEAVIAPLTAQLAWRGRSRHRNTWRWRMW